RGLRDVAFVPEGDVLEADESRRAHDAGETADPLGDLGVALVRHRRGPLHALPERLLDLAHLGAREMPDLCCEALERACGECERPMQIVFLCSCARVVTEASARSIPSRTSLPASWICSESAVSTTSEEVNP